MHRFKRLCPDCCWPGQDIFGSGVPAAFSSGLLAATSAEPVLFAQLRV